MDAIRLRPLVPAVGSSACTRQPLKPVVKEKDPQSAVVKAQQYQVHQLLQQYVTDVSVKARQGDPTIWCIRRRKYFPLQA